MTTDDPFDQHRSHAMTSTITEPPTLEGLGDALAASTERDLRARRGRSIRRVAVAGVLVALIATGTVAAATLLSPKQVAAGMPAGAVIFDGTHPTCAADPAGRVFHCTLTHAPRESSDYTGTKEVLVVDGKAAGGCIGRDAAGMTWDCYVGQDAVDQEIITQDFLGEPAGPGVG
jgi:hypothetical protein